MNPDDRRSTSRYCVFVGSNLIQFFLTELGVPFTTPTIYRDNLSVVSLSYNPVLHCHTKHVELDVHFVILKTLMIYYVPAVNQSSMLTKSLSSTSFCYL
ncbi:hypothetical protein CR513_50423, partial [Mucuna pruriens]